MAKHYKKRNIIPKIMLIIFSILLIISIVQITRWYLNNRRNSEIIEEMQDYINIEEKETEIKYNINFEELKEINEDVVAFLKVNGTDVEFIVVQGNDNDYYLTHNLKKEYNKAGWIFADYENKLDGTDKNIVVHGHNMRDDSMFGTLRNILTEEWYENENNRYITFITENEESTYEAFSVYQIEREDYYINTKFTDTEFEQYLETVKARSITDFNVELNTEDKVLTLSTCANNSNYRIVLHAKKL